MIWFNRPVFGRFIHLTSSDPVRELREFLPPSLTNPKKPKSLSNRAVSILSKFRSEFNRLIIKDLRLVKPVRLSDGSIAVNPTIATCDQAHGF
jgi:hypothetical protein